jgi:hypothetical protein
VAITRSASAFQFFGLWLLAELEPSAATCLSESDARPVRVDERLAAVP